MGWGWGTDGVAGCGREWCFVRSGWLGERGGRLRPGGVVAAGSRLRTPG